MERFLLETVCDAGDVCPPLVVGIGLGSSLDRVGYLALKASIRPLGSVNPDSEIEALERRWLGLMNETGMGAMNLGGDVSVLACHIEGGLTHSVHTLMAVRPECWCNRRATVVVTPDGTVRISEEVP
jgi:fumarate hydratase subunit alpha